MIASLQGRLIAKDTQGVVIECAGVGYGVAMSLLALARVGEVGALVRLYVYTHLSQDALRLFGFVEAQELDTFKILIRTSGVGPQLALAILSTLTPGELASAVEAADTTRLMGIPKVGAKKAARLLVELQDRLQASLQLESCAAAGPVMKDLLSALMNLGFSPTVAQRAARQALQQHGYLEGNPAQPDLPMLVRHALQLATARAVH